MFKNLYDQLQQNDRLRWGLALIIGILWFYGILLLRDSVEEKSRQYLSTTQAIHRLRDQLTQTEWAQRVEPVKTLTVQLEAKVWQATTAGLAQAALQDALNTITLKAGVVRSQINVTVVEDTAPSISTPNQAKAATDAGLPEGLWKVKAKIAFDFSAPTLLDFLSQIETAPKQMVVGTLGVNKDVPNRVDVELYAYFQKPTSNAVQPQKQRDPS